MTNSTLARALGCGLIVLSIAFNPVADQPSVPLRYFILTAGAALSALWLLRNRPQLPSLWVRAWAAFLAATTIATVLSDDPRGALFGDPQRRMGLVTWACFAALSWSAAIWCGDHRNIVWLYRAAATIGIIEGVIAVAETIGISPYPVVGTSSRAAGSIGNSGMLATLMVVVIPLAGVVALRDDRKWSAVGTAGIGGAIAATIASGTRAALVAIAFQLVIALLLARRRTDKDQRRVTAHGETRRRTITVSATILFCGGLPILLNLSRLSDWFGRSRGAFSTGVGRLDTWRLALQLVSKSPLFGVGPEQFVTHFPSVISASYERTYARARIPDRAHSLAIDLLSTVGVTGLLTFAAVIGVACALIYRNRALWTADSRSPWIAAGCLAVAGGLVAELLLFPTLDVDPLIWVALGALVGVSSNAGPAGDAADVAARTRTAKRGTPLKLPVSGTHAQGTVAAAIATMLVLAVTAIGTFEAAAGMYADRLSRDAKLNGYLHPDAAIATLKRAASIQPQSNMHLYNLAAVARASNRRDFHDDAIRALDDRIKSYPNDPYLRSAQAQTLLSVASRFHDCSAAKQAIVHIEHGLKFDPNSAQLHLFLGSANFELGRYDSAETNWQIADDLLGRFGAAQKNLDVLAEVRASPNQSSAVPCRKQG